MIYQKRFYSVSVECFTGNQGSKSSLAGLSNFPDPAEKNTFHTANTRDKAQRVQI